MVGIVDILLKNRQFNRFGTPPILPDTNNEIPEALGSPIPLPGMSPVPTTTRPSVFNTPAQNESLEPPNLLQRISGRLSEGLSSPLGRFGASLLASSGPSLTPQSTLSNVGGALLNTQALGRQDTLDDLQRQLIESRIGLNAARGQVGANTNVQSTFEGANGNMHIVTRNGEVKDTGVPFNERLQVITAPDGSVRLIDPTRGAGEEGVEVISSEEAISGAAARTAATEEAKGDPDRARSLPISIARGEQELERQQQAIDALEAGTLDTGPIAQVFSRFTSAGQRFGQLTGQAVIDAISSATFGQLSEGEREFLRTTTIDLGAQEDVNIETLRRMQEITRKALEIERKDLQRLQESESDELEQFRQQGLSIRRN